MKTAWLKLSAIGLVGALSATACTITTGDGEGGTGGGSSSTGGTSSTGGSKATGGTTSTGGSKATGGTASTGGSKATGGTSSTGGATSTGGQATVFSCDDATGSPSTKAATSCEFEPTDLTGPLGECLTCLSKAANCCDELKDCYGTAPFNQCGYGGPEDGDTEYLCYQDCLVGKAKAAGGAYDPDLDTNACADSCATTSCGGPPIGSASSVLIGCMHAKCDTECFVTPAM